MIMRFGIIIFITSVALGFLAHYEANLHQCFGIIDYINVEALESHLAECRYLPRVALATDVLGFMSAICIVVLVLRRVVRKTFF
jgi:hypothetical protein